LSRGPSGDIEVLPLNKNGHRHKNEAKEKEKEPAIDEPPSTSGSGESSGTAVNDGDEITNLEEVERELQRELDSELQGQEVKDWALRVDDRRPT
jgi:hypothetical protein